MNGTEKSPINAFLEGYAKKDTYPFHMPGHKRNKDLLNFGGLNFLDMDITEIAGADNLMNPTGILQAAQENMARVFGADKTFMLVNGSSAGILAAVLSTCADGGEIILARNCHISAYNGVVLSGAKPVYVYPEMTDYGIAGGILPKNLEKLLSQHEHVKAVLITNPTFEGFCSDISQIADIVHKHGKTLIIDEAHGAHFGFHEAFPKSALSLGADIVIQSLHKTLPALNQSALLHVKGNRVSAESLGKCISMLQTTSPSYLLMATMEQCVNLIDTSGELLFERYAEALKTIRRSMRKNNVVQLIGEELIGQCAISDVDIGKLVFVINSGDMSGPEFEAALREKANIQLEMSGLHHVVALTSIADKPFGFDRLAQGINEMNKCLKFMMKPYKMVYDTKKHTQMLTPREATFKAAKWADLQACIGKVAAGFVSPYPPGIPLVVPGEVISQETVAYIENCMMNAIPVVGLEKGCLQVIL